jgi:hypothetical protein
MNGLRALMIGFAAVLLAMACATEPVTPFTEAPIAAGQARLYVYRPESPVTPTGSNRLWLDGRDLAAVDSDGYVTVTLPPGSHRLDPSLQPPDIANATRPRMVELHPDGATYCRLFGIPSIYGTRWDVRCSDDPNDHPELRACHLRAPDPEGDWQP